MRRRIGIRSGLVAVVIVAALSSLWSKAHAVDGGTGVKCTLPDPSIDCSGINAAVCQQYNAVCKNNLCACSSSVVDGGAHDAGIGDLGGSGGTGGTGGGMTGGSNGSAPIIGGGQTEPLRSGCSFVPGAR
jgi:hypothetical protein